MTNARKNQSVTDKRTVDPKRSLAAKKAAETRALNRELAAKRSLRLHHKIITGGVIAAVIVFTVIGVRTILTTYAATQSKAPFSVVGLSGKCLDNNAGILKNKNTIQLWKCNGGAAQQWTATSTGGVKLTGGDFCLDVPGSSKAEYTYIQLWKCNGTNAQKFSFKNGALVNKNTGFCLTVRYGSSKDGTRVWMNKCAKTPSASQKWAQKTQSSGSISTGSNGTGSSAASPSVGSNNVKYGIPERPFAANSPWNTPLPTNPAIDANSGAISRSVLTNPNLVVNTILYAYGQPTYIANANTPRINVSGRSPFNSVPIDPSWRQNDGADGKMNVFDPQTGYSYELQDYNPSARSAYWAVRHNYVTGLGDGYPPNGELRGPTGSGMTQLGGMIRISDIKNGSIDHALSFITSDPQAGTYRYPASGTDGKRTAPYGIAEGMRIQLDPSLDLEKIPGITKAEIMIGKALQKYGAYCTDTGGGNNMAMGFYAEKPTTTADPYPGIGLGGDWAQLRNIPRDRYRVIAESVTKRP